MRKWSEIRNEHIDDEEQKVYIDAWLSHDGDEEGKVIAKVDMASKEVEYIDEDARYDEYAQEIINEAKTFKIED